MKIYYLLISIRLVRSAFYQQTIADKIGYDRIVSETDSAPSAISCVHYCKRIDSLSNMIYKEGSCKCVKGGSRPKGSSEGTEIFIKEKKLKEDVNVALKKPATQSRRYEGCEIARCGAANGNDGTPKASITHYTDSVPWWRVDLLKEVTIKKIKVTLDGYALQTNLYGDMELTTRQGNGVWNVCERLGKPTTLHIESNCGGPINARYVKVASYKRQPLYLQEVEVYAIDYFTKF